MWYPELLSAVLMLARYAVRQASNEKAKQYGEERIPFANMGWKMVEAAKEKQASQAKL